MRGWIVAALGLWAHVVSAETVTWESQGGQVNLAGGGNTGWVVVNTFGTSDGTIDGTCTTTGAGVAITNAVFDVGGLDKGDTFDAGLTVWVNGALFTAPPTFDLTGTTLTAGPTAIAGLDVTVQHAAIATRPVLRTLVGLRNPGTAPIPTTLQILSNFASDADTDIRGTSTGEDAWQVTSDDPMSPTGAPILAVWYGGVGPHGFGSGVAGFNNDPDVFPCSGTEGLRLTETLAVPPGGTVYFLLFTQLAATNEAAVAAGGAYEGALDPALLDGLDDATRLRVLNFNLLGEIELVGGGPGSGSRWYVSNLALPDNAAPIGGECSAGPGLAVGDAVLDPDGTNDVDPFDYGAMIFVDGQAFASSLHPTVTASSFRDGPFPLAGLDTSVAYTALPGDTARLRTVATFTNPGTSTVNATVTFATNVGSDDGTQVRASSSGDAALDGADRWVVTSDSNDPTGDPVVTHVLAGPGAIAVGASLVSSEVFDCSTTQGIRAEFPLTVPPGETRALLFFDDLHATIDDAVASAPVFDGAPSAAMLQELGAALADVVNWPFCANDPALCDDGDACTVDACGATGGCSRTALPATADFLSVGCRMTDLLARVNALPAGKVRDALAAKLAAAQTAATAAAGLVGQIKPYKKQLRKAAKALKAFEKKLATKPARKIADQPTRDELKTQSSGLRASLKALGAAV